MFSYSHSLTISATTSAIGARCGATRAVWRARSLRVLAGVIWVPNVVRGGPAHVLRQSTRLELGAVRCLMEFSIPSGLDSDARAGYGSRICELFRRSTQIASSRADTAVKTNNNACRLGQAMEQFLERDA